MPSRRKSRKSRTGRRNPQPASRNSRLNPLVLYNTMAGGQEHKLRALTLVGAAASVGTAGVPVRLSQIAQGLDFTERIGRAIIIKSVSFCGQLIGGQTNSAVDENRNIVRIAIVSMNPGTALAAATYNVESIIDPRYVSGLKHVYYDRFFSLDSPGRDTTGYMPACRQVSCPKIPIHLRVDYTSNIATSESDTSLWIWFISDSGAVPNPGFGSGAIACEFIDA